MRRGSPRASAGRFARRCVVRGTGSPNFLAAPRNPRGRPVRPAGRTGVGMFSVAKPRIDPPNLRESQCVSRRFRLCRNKWKPSGSPRKTERTSGDRISDNSRPAIATAIHGSSSWEISIGEAFSFYSFIKSQVDLGAVESPRFFDFGCGWGRMTRPFLRDFDLDKMFGFEPNLLLATVARSLKSLRLRSFGRIRAGRIDTEELVRHGHRLVDFFSPLQILASGVAEGNFGSPEARRDRDFHDLGIAIPAPASKGPARR